MKNASNELIEFLLSDDSKTMKIADLYTITLSDGTQLFYTSADFDISYNGKKFLAKNACIKRGKISWQTGLSVDDLSIEFNPSEDDIVKNVPMIKAFVDGYFDGATFKLDLIFYKDKASTVLNLNGGDSTTNSTFHVYDGGNSSNEPAEIIFGGNSWGIVKIGWNGSALILEKLFVGTLDIEEITGSYAKGSVKSPVEKLNCDFPRNCYQANCHHTLYDSYCGLNKSNFSESSISIEENSTTTKIYCTLAHPAGYFTNGIVEFLDGNNSGLKRAVKIHEDGVLTLATPLLFTPEENDTFTVRAGCNKSIDMCKTKFNNFANFGGTPFIPEGDSTI
jgi:hypothetical protein